MRPSDTTANPLLLLYNTIYHFTPLAFGIQHQIPTQQHQGYNTITWKLSKKNDILPHCIISITQSHRPIWCLCDPFTPLQTLSFYFIIQYIILPRLPLLFNIKYLLSSTKDTIQWLEKFKKKRNTCLLHHFNHPIPLAKMMPMRPTNTTAKHFLLLYNMLSHCTSLAFDIQHQIPTQQHQGYNTITWIFSKKKTSGERVPLDFWTGAKVGAGRVSRLGRREGADHSDVAEAWKKYKLTHK